MNILLIGGGGREHALCWKMAQSDTAEKIFAAPGNPGMVAIGAGTQDADRADKVACVALNVNNHDDVVAFCRENSVELVVIGPEAPLVDGLADSLNAANIAVFGPSEKAAQLEGSKGFTKDLCAKADIPTAQYARVYNIAEARAALASFGLPVVIKADGLAAGKGVIIAETAEDAEHAIGHMFAGGFGDAGAEVVIEEFLTGEEASFFAICDGKTVIPFGSAQDHKRVGDGDTGPNTGGMGAYSPAPVLTDALQQQVMDEIIHPTVAAMAEMGAPYVGVLYAGLMLTETGLQLIEYNCRFGDPECQVLMMRYAGDMVELLHHAATAKLDKMPAPQFIPQTALTVVMAAKGYPASPEKGGLISGLDKAAETGAMVFHAGTKQSENGDILANGGRVLNVTALGDSVSEAAKSAYQAVNAIDFPTGFYRKDIGWRAIAREQEKG